MRASAVRRIAEGYLGDLLDQHLDDTDLVATASGLINQADDYKVTRDQRLIIIWDLNNDTMADPAPEHQEPINRPPEPPDGQVDD